MSDPISQSINSNISPTIAEFLDALPSSEDVEETFQDNPVSQEIDDLSIVQKRIKTKPMGNGLINSVPLLNATAVCEGSTASFTDNFKPNKDDCITKLELQVKKMKTELQSAKKLEIEIKTQLTQIQQSETQMRAELKIVKSEMPSTQAKLQHTQTRLTNEKQTAQVLDKRLTEEKKVRQQLQIQLDTERKFRQEDSETNAKAIQAVAVAAARSADCGENCKKQRKEMESEISTLRRDTRLQEEHILMFSRQAVEWPNLIRIAEEHRDLMCRISTVKDENLHLTEQLRELNKMKQELLTSYHSSQLEIKELDFVLKKKNYQIFELQNKFQAHLPMNEYSTGGVHSFGMEPAHCHYNCSSYSPSYTHQSNSGSGRHSTNDSPLYMAYPTNHSP